jgi:hypothetical protein
MSDLPTGPVNVNAGPEPFTKVCRRCGQYVNPRAYVCPYCKKQLRTSPLTALIALFIGFVFLGTIVTAVVQQAVPGTAPAFSVSGPDSNLNVCIDAKSLSGRRPREVVPGLRHCGWDSVEYNRGEEMIEMHASDGSRGLVQYDKGRLLFANFDIPQVRTVTPEQITSAFRLHDLPAPTEVWEFGMRWRDIPTLPRVIEGIRTNVTTHYGVTYASEERISRWEDKK